MAAKHRSDSVNATPVIASSPVETSQVPPERPINGRTTVLNLVEQTQGTADLLESVPFPRRSRTSDTLRFLLGWAQPNRQRLKSCDRVASRIKFVGNWSRRQVGSRHEATRQSGNVRAVIDFRPTGSVDR
jgi:hypothetical protein